MIAGMVMRVDRDEGAPPAASAAAGDLVDLARYPIADLTSAAAQELVANYRHQLAETGVALLRGFLTPAAAAAMAAAAPSRPIIRAGGGCAPSSVRSPTICCRRARRCGASTPGTI